MKTASQEWVERCQVRRPGGFYVTPEDVGDRVEGIRQALAEDDVEAAELATEQLHVDVLYALSRRLCEDPWLCAFVAYKTEELPWPDEPEPESERRRP